MYIAVADRWAPDYMHLNYEEYKKRFQTIFDPDYDGPNGDKGNYPGDMHLNTSRSVYVWLPLRFEGDNVIIDWHDQWKIEDFAEKTDAN